MTAYDKIAIVGMAKADEFGLIKLKEKIEIPFFEDMIENFINTIIEDIGEFLTLEQYTNTKKLYSFCATYCYGKGAEFALSHRINEPIQQIAYNFDNCMQGFITLGYPENIADKIIKHLDGINAVYEVMYLEIYKNQDELLHNDISFNNCLFRIFSCLFYMGKKVGLSMEIESDIHIDINANDFDIKYDYDNYDQKYSDDDFKSN